MRLLNTSTLEFRWLTEDEPTPPYAALSHCWGTDEVLYDDLQNTRLFSQKYGFQKLLGACREALDGHNLDWLWADTVCIDRSSSAERAESINSMYRWYRNCSICLAYLDDICSSGTPEDMANSRWMQRSWTLIELIAPRQLKFYKADWSVLGTKESLISILSSITHIDQAVLEDAETVDDISIGKRMSWAAQRSARKVEDVAYSLLGIFRISMEVRYGEGNIAFMRLQEELLKTLKDASLFAWKSSDNQQYRGLLARSPSEFGHFSLLRHDTTPWRLPLSLRLAFTMPTLTCSFTHSELIEDVFMPLTEISMTSNCGGNLGIKFRKWRGELVRCDPQSLFYVSCNSFSDTQDIPVIRDVDSRTSKLISQSMTEEMQQRTRQATSSVPRDSLLDEHDLVSFQPVKIDYCFHQEGEETASELTGPAFSAAAKSSYGMSLLQRPSSRIPKPTEHASEDAGTCDDTSVSSALDNDLSDESPGYEDYLFGSPALECRPMDLDPRFGEQTGALTKVALGRFSTWMAGCSAACKRPQSSEPFFSKKRLRAECLFKHTEVESHEVNGEEDTLFVELKGPRSYACPFYVRDKARYLQCLTRNDLVTIPDLKKHIWNSHRQPYYCPTCGTEFRRASIRDDHIKARACDPQQWKGTPQGLSETQLQSLAQRAKPGTSDGSQWYSIWELVYPDTGVSSPRQAPATPYLTSELESVICVARKFWSQEGQVVVADFLAQRNLQGYRTPNEERSLAALYQITLDSMVDQLVHILRADDCHIEPSSTLSNVIRSFRKLCSRMI
ncbi:HET-domain-containing protein [Apiospora arundinis]